MPSIVYFFHCFRVFFFSFNSEEISCLFFYSLAVPGFQESENCKNWCTAILGDIGIVREIRFHEHLNTLHSREYDTFLLELGLKLSDSVLFMCSTIARVKTLIQMDMACERVWL